MDNIEIIKGCQSGNRRAQEALYQEFGPLLMRVCRRYSRSIYDADDIFQEAFIRIFNNISKFEIDRKDSNILGWLTRVTVNVAIRHVQKESKLSFPDFDEIGPTSSTAVEGINDLAMDDIHTLIDSLPQNQKIVFNLFGIEGYNHKEIANMLGISEGTSRSHLSMARNSLKGVYHKINIEQGA